jgi:hypothetical protein
MVCGCWWSSAVGKVRVVFKRGSRFQIRNSPKVVQYLETVGTMLMDDANATLPENEGYRMSSSKGINYPYGRWMVNVYTSSNHAKNSNAKNQTLLRMLRAS